MDTVQKFGQMFFAIGLFAVLMALVLVIAGRSGRGRSSAWQGRVFVIPAVLLISVGLVYPALRTIYQSFFNSTGRKFVGGSNYAEIFTDPAMRTVLMNTVAWVVLTPLIATAFGLVYAVLVDQIKFEKAWRRRCCSSRWRSPWSARRSSGSSCTTTGPRPVRLPDRAAQPDPRLARHLNPTSSSSPSPVEHLLPHRGDDLDPGGVRDDDPVGGDQGGPDDIVEAASSTAHGHPAVPVQSRCRRIRPASSWSSPPSPWRR